MKKIILFVTLFMAQTTRVPWKRLKPAKYCLLFVPSRKLLFLLGFLIIHGSGLQLNAQQNALDFDGTNDYVQVSDHNDLDLTSALTIEAWIYLEDNIATTIVSKGDVFGTANYVLGTEVITRNLYFYGTNYHTSSSSQVPLNTWTHVAVTYTGTTVTFYINGSQTDTDSQNLGAANSDALEIGGTSSGNYFDGRIDEVRIWNKLLSVAEISNIYNKTISVPSNLSSCLVAYYKMDETSGTSLPDETGNGHNGTLMNMNNSDWVSSTAPLFSQNFSNCNFQTCTDPSGMSASNITTSAADLSWTENGSATTWNLEWKAGSDFTPGTGAEDGSATVNTTPAHSLSSLSSGTTYYVYYRSDCSSSQSSWVGAYTFTTTCTAPSGISASNITSSAADLSWTENGSATTWNLEWKAGSDFTPGTGAQDGSATVNTTPAYSMSGLSSSTMYYVYYRSDCSANQSSWVGAYTFSTSAGGGGGSSVLGECNTLDFDGTDDYVEVPDDATLDFANTGTYTLEAWVYKEGENALTTAAHIIHKGEAGNQNYILGVAGSNAGGDADKPFFTTGSTINLATTQLSHNTWHHIAVTYNNGSFKIYVNGVQENSGTVTGGTPSNNPLRICWSAINVGDNRSLNGKVDDLRIWNVERSVTEILASYRGELCGNETGLVLYYDFNQGTAGGNNSGISSADDKTSNNNDGALNGFAKTGNNGNFVTSTAIQKNGLHFDGTDDYINLGQIDALDNVGTFTYEFWAKQPDPSSNEFFFYNGDNDQYFFFFNEAGTDKLTILITKNTAANQYGATTTNTFIATNTWQHFALVYDGSLTNANRLKLYIDGAQVGLTTIGTIETTTPTTVGNFHIGATNGPGGYFEGIVDDLRIWSTARTAGEISANMNSEITSSTSDLIAYYKFNQGNENGTNTNVTTLKDLSINCNHGTLTNFGLTGSSSNWGSSASVFPVELTYFRAQPIDKSSLLTWETATETNNEGFEIQWAGSSEQLAVGSWEKDRICGRCGGFL